MRDLLNNVDEESRGRIPVMSGQRFGRTRMNFLLGSRGDVSFLLSNLPWEMLPPDPVGLDVGCGSGRWSLIVRSAVGHLHLMDPSPEALAVCEEQPFAGVEHDISPCERRRYSARGWLA